MRTVLKLVFLSLSLGKILVKQSLGLTLLNYFLLILLSNRFCGAAIFAKSLSLG